MESLYELYYDKVIPLLISDFELELNYIDKMENTKKDLKELVLEDIKNDFENNIDKIIDDFKSLDYSKDSLEMKNAKMVLNEIKKYYDIDFNVKEML